MFISSNNLWQWKHSQHSTSCLYSLITRPIAVEYLTRSIAHFFLLPYVSYSMMRMSTCSAHQVHGTENVARASVKGVPSEEEVVAGCRYMESVYCV